MTTKQRETRTEKVGYNAVCPECRAGRGEPCTELGAAVTWGVHERRLTAVEPEDLSWTPTQGALL